MKQKISYQNYFSKVYGCWLGKCIAGNIGAPYEGMKQRLALEYSPDYLREMLPNDDLDLQVLWLEVLQKKGEYFTTDDLSEIFANNCDYAPGEYAFFKKNYRRGIPAPYAGTFNNQYYTDGMGAPIRSEIWACICLGNPALAAEYAEKDAVIDHMANSCSVNGERFFAALESMAFFQSDVKKLIMSALDYVDKNNRFYALVTDVMQWSETYDFWTVRNKIIREYGNVEATDTLQNTGFLLAALLMGNMDFITTTMNAVNCGFDTDCTAATVGAIMGIILGAESLIKTFGIERVQFKLGVRSNFASDDVYDLAKETCRMGVYFAEKVNDSVQIDGFMGEKIHIPVKENLFESTMIYDGEPAIGFGESKICYVEITNRTNQTLQIQTDIQCESPLSAKIETGNFALNPNAKQRIKIVVTAEEANVLPDGNKLTLTISCNGEKQIKTFGFAGKARWNIYGPFWKNVVDVPPLEKGESYWKYFVFPTEEILMDKIRHYHMNSLPDLSVGVDEYADTEARTVDIGIDEVRLGEYERFVGQAAYWLETAFYSDEEKEIGGIQIGYQDSFKFYLNGKLLAKRCDGNMYTPENVHLFNVKVKKGVNTISVQLVKRHKDVKFSYNLLSAGVTSDHLLLGHVNIKKEKIN